MTRVHVHLKTAKVELTFDGAQDAFERRIEPLLMGLARGRRKASPAEPVAEPVAKTLAEREAPDGYAPPSTSFATFQRQLAPEANGASGRIAAYAFFLWNYEKQEIFGEDEMRGCFAAEGLEAPTDLRSVVETLCERRILETSGDEAWRLTPKGLNRVRKTLG